MDKVTKEQLSCPMQVPALGIEGRSCCTGCNWRPVVFLHGNNKTHDALSDRQVRSSDRLRASRMCDVPLQRARSAHVELAENGVIH